MRLGEPSKIHARFGTDLVWFIPAFLFYWENFKIIVGTTKTILKIYVMFKYCRGYQYQKFSPNTNIFFLEIQIPSDTENLDLFLSLNLICHVLWPN